MSIRPTSNDDREAWKAYWTAQGMPWRTEPEIGEERQRYLAARQTITPDALLGIYPFKDINLTRRDVEWMLVLHAGNLSMSPDIDESPMHPDKSIGLRPLDLRGANLQNIDLSELPLAGSLFGLQSHFTEVTAPPSSLLSKLGFMRIRRISIRFNMLPGIEVGAEFAPDFLAKPRSGARRGVEDEKALRMSFARLLDDGYIFTSDDMEAAAAHLEHANLSSAGLERCTFTGSHLEGANLRRAQASEANFSTAHLDGTDMAGADLTRANLRRASLSSTTFLASTSLEYATLADVQWNGANIALIDWLALSKLGDEHQACQRKSSQGKQKSIETRRGEYEAAIRACRQIAAVLDSQGLVEQRNHFAYRALIAQRQLAWKRGIRKWLAAFGSWILWLTSGYGYRPLWSFIIYALVVGAFAITYYLLGNNVNPALDPLSAVVFSITSFHGRGFMPGEKVLLNNPLTVIAAGEAIIGLLIEITFIATFTQRFFAR